MIFKDLFLFATAAASLKGHIDGIGKPPVAVPVVQIGTEPLTKEQKKTLLKYQASLTKWEMKNIVKQAIASLIPDSLFIEVRRKETVLTMWDAVRDQREKKS